MALALLIWISVPKLVFGQDLLRYARQLTIDDGLSQSTVNCIFQDSEGFLWFGTQSGLNKYDGHGFTVYVNNPLDSTSISNNWIFSISEDKNQNLWIGTRNGLNCLDKRTGRFRRFVHQPGQAHSLKDNSVFSVLADSRGRIWAKTRSVLHKYLPAEERFYAYEHYTEYFQPSQSDINFPILEDNLGKIWVGSRTGLDHFDPHTDTFNKFFHDPDDTTTLTHNAITALLLDSHNNLWVATENGLNRFDRQHARFQQFRFVSQRNDPTQFNNISSLCEDHQGHLWVGTQGGGLIRLQVEFKGQVPVVLADNYLLSKAFPQGHRNNVVYSLLQDASHNLWIGTDVSGLLKVDLKPKKLRVYTDGSHPGLVLPSNTVTAVLQTSDDEVWIGTRGQGLVLWDKKRRSSVRYASQEVPARRLLNDFVQALHLDTKQRLWIGTRGGVHLLDRRTGRLRTLSHFFPHIFYASFGNVRVNVIRGDTLGNVWIGTNYGLHMFNIESLEVRSFYHEYSDANTLSHNNVYDLVLAPDGAIWVATFDGVNRLRPQTDSVERFAHAQPMPSLARSTVYNLLLLDSTLWAGTASGLVGMHTGSLREVFFSQDDGLPNQSVFKLLAASNGDIWGSTGRGLFRLSKGGQLTQFDKDDGLQNLEFNTGVGCLAPNGQMLFGSVVGFVEIDPNDVPANPLPPRVRITEYALQGPKGRYTNGYPGHRIDLKHNDYDLTIRFAALDYTASNRNQYAYRMVGLSNEWIHIGNRPFVSFSRLRPGTYRFQVRGSNNDGLWSTQAQELVVMVHPPWWQQTWAVVLYLTLGVTLVFALVSYRERSLQYAKMQLQRSVAMRTREIEQQKEEIATQRDLAVQQRQQIESQKAELEKTLTQLTTTQKQLVESAKMASLGNLVAGVAHEINTPVGIGITASSAVLERTEAFARLYASQQASAKELQSYLQAVYSGSKLILANLQRTGELVKSFKQISVDESNERLREFDLNEYLHDVVRSLQPKFKGRPVQVHIDCPTETALTSYPGAFAQIFTNLILNSLTHAFEANQPGLIRIVCRPTEAPGLCIDYYDDGRGIAPEHHGQVFDPFFTTDMQHGTGLGMHIVYNLITQKLKGSIEHQTNHRPGVWFQIRLPIPLMQRLARLPS